ncbi:MAG: lipid-A-disaccharide synthase [Pseudobdellovibrionaceae bacterium]|nr:lipid-A-disaccharide synthase [Bdellovibrionales bacterium]USN48895.1 MAG: lipid-A-disaccharide synthase [Pseudobdellovibrionaceae bacterium]
MGLLHFDWRRRSLAKSNPASNEILIVAAEASSTLYAQRLLEYWRQQNQSIASFGIGSRSMEAMGFEILGRSEELAVVGFQEVMAHWGDIKGAFDRLVEAAKERKPKVALLLDYPDFNLRLAKKLKKLGIPVVYYISPQVWAWRRSRVKIIRRLVDKMLVLFPFEKDFYDKNGVSAEFVGHPLLDELKSDLFDQNEIKKDRQRYGIKDNETLLALMPGSRHSEIKNHLETQLAVAERLHGENEDLQVALFVAPTFDLETFKSNMPPLQFPLIVLQDEPFRMIRLADVVLCASGTATLLVGLLEKPMVIMYKMNAMTAWIAKTFVKDTPFFGMINLVLGKMVAPEFFQEAASVEGLAGALRRLINEPTAAEEMACDLKQAKVRLGSEGATTRVAKALDGYFS